MSSHPLQSQLAEIRDHVRRVLLTRGLSSVASVLIGATLLACLGDWLFHFDDAGVRLILAFGILASSAWMAHRYLLLPLRHPFADLELALRVEERYPGFQDSLASTVQFLEGNGDPALGSPALQQAVIQKTLGEVQHLDFRDVVETRGLRQISAVAVCVCVMTAVLVALNQRDTGIALHRLLLPFSAPAWPRNTNLRLLNAELQPIDIESGDPLRVSRGEQLKLFVENLTGRLPSKVVLEYRLPGERAVSEVLRSNTLRDPQGGNRELAAGQVLASKGPIQLRASGGDDVLPWLEVQVIPPPVVASLQVVLTPPAYTKRPVERLPEGVGHVQGFVGTGVEVTARVNKPLRTAALRLRDQERRPVSLSEDGLQLSAKFTINESGIHSYWLDLQDMEGFENSEAPRYEVRGIQDLVPDISIDTPSSDLQITENAEVQLRASAKDDLGLKDISLVYRMGEGDVTPAVTVPLFSGEQRPQQQGSEYLWKMSELKPAPGTRIVFHAEATDDYDLGPPHVGRSISRTLTVVTKEAKVQELAERQAGLLEDLERALKQETQSRDQISELQIQLENAGKFRTQDIDTLQRVELSQRQVAAQLTGESDGLDKRAKALLTELKDNKIDDPESARRFERFANELGRLGEESLPAIEQDLTRVRKLAQDEIPANKSTPKTKLSAAGKRATTSPKGKPQGADKSRSEAATTAQQRGAAPQLKSAESGTQNKSSSPAKGDSANEQDASKPGANEKQPGTAGEKSPGDKGTEAKESKKSGGSPDGTPSPSAKPAEQPDGANPETSPSKEEKTGKPEPTQPDSTETGAAPPDRTGRPDSGKSPEAGKTKKPEGDAKTQQEGLARIAENQTAVIESLAEMAQQVAKWRNERDAAQDLSEIQTAQKDLNRDTNEVGRQTLAKQRSELTPQQQADLARLAERQQRNSENLDKLQNKMQSMVEQLQSADPAAAEALREALEHAQQSAPSGQMRDAARQISANKTGEAAQAQQRVADQLREMEDILRNRHETDAEGLVKKLKQAEQALDSLQKTQQDLMRKTREAGENPDAGERQAELERLRKQQQELREEAVRMARRLERLQARKSAATSRRAGSRMEQAQENMEQGDAEFAEKEQQESLDDLEQAQRELARERREAEERLAQEQLAKIADSLKGLIAREQTVIDETKRLEALHAGRGNWTRAQLRSLRDLTEVQRGLKQETDELAAKLSAAEVFALALKGAARSMERALELLGERQTGEPTVKAEQASMQRFIDLIEVLKPDDPSNKQDGEEQGGGGGGNESGQPGESIPELAQLKLLKTMEADLLARSLDLSERIEKNGGKLSEAERRELADLASEQGALADQARNLMQSLSEPEEEDEEADGEMPERKAPEGDEFDLEGEQKS